ncbi:hypothetical protein ACTFIZ_001494, partial [Dictyostelium cf. discoideum]
DY